MSKGKRAAIIAAIVVAVLIVVFCVVNNAILSWG